MKKKLVATVLAGVMALSVAMTGCGSSSDTADGTFTPTKSIQWMCTSSAGGGSDIFTRMIGDIMTTNGMVNDQTIVVTNKTDGAGEVGRNEVAMMKKNPDYVLADHIKLDEYVYKVVADRNTALELYLNGELDEVALSPEAIEQYVDDPSIKVAPATSIQTLAINHGNTNNNGILGNLNFRKALFYAVDRQSIAKMTNGIPANYLVASKCLGLDGKTFREMPESQEYLTENLGYDPKLAKEYYDKAMEECGLTSLTLTLQYNETSANNKAASEFLHKSFPEIFGDSFTLELMAAPSGVLNSYIKGWKDGDPNSFELQWRGWNTSTPAPWNGLKVYTGMYSNKNEPYYNDEVDALWEKANYDLEAKMDSAYRLELTREIEKIVLDEVAACPVYEAPSYYLINPKVILPSDVYIPGYGFGFTISDKEV